MWRFLAGVGSALLLITAGVLIWRNQAPAANSVTGPTFVAGAVQLNAQVAPPV